MRVNKKDRSDAIQEAARRLLEERQIDITQQVIIPPLAKGLAQQMNCHIDTAKRHIARAVRLARGEVAHEGTWGGVRRGERAIAHSRVAIHITAASALELQRLMLFYPDVKTPEAMVERLIQQALEISLARQLAPHAADEAAEEE